MTAFLDEIITQFYETCPQTDDKFAFGQIFRVPAYYPHEFLEVWRPNVFDARMGFASDFNIPGTTPKDVFKRPQPYSSPRLQTTEEFIAIRGKPRPVIMTQPPDPRLRKLGGGRRIARHLCPVALVFSAVDETEASKLPQDFVDRVRRLEYPQFLFLPTGGPITRDSIVRFDELQSVVVQQLEPTGYSLVKDVAAIMRSQVSFYLTGLSADQFSGWAGLLHEA